MGEHRKDGCRQWIVTASTVIVAVAVLTVAVVVLLVTVSS